MQKFLFFLLVALLPGFFISAPAQNAVPADAGSASTETTTPDPSATSLRLARKTVPLGHPVYRLLDLHEAAGELSFLPQVKPYNKGEIIALLQELISNPLIGERPKEVIGAFLRDFLAETTGVRIYSQSGPHSYALAGFGATVGIAAGVGENASSSLSLNPRPYLSGDLGEHISFHASMGPSLEKLAPDLFTGSTTHHGQVHFPSSSSGRAFLPYQSGFETLHTHTLISGKQPGKGPFTDGLAIGFSYYSELKGSWYGGRLQAGVNNQRRAWGHDDSNMLLSASARRMPAFEFKLHPFPWLRYSWLTGSLFAPGGNGSGAPYGYDTGEVHNLLTLQLLEITPTRWLQISASTGNLWVKRMEPAYLLPFTMTHFTELEVGDFDNNAISADIALLFPRMGKAWFSFYIDEFSFTESGALLRMPRNRYGWQAGWKTSLLSSLLPGTLSTLKYSRLSPFVYTHYPETRVNAFTSRALDMSYTHDGANLGFYLPPNSAELHWSLVNMAIPDLVLSLDSRVILHGTNDLVSPNIYQVYGDIYRYQLTPEGGDIHDYPLTDFGKDGIYDRTFMTEFRFDRKIRLNAIVPYFRVAGSAGISHTRWESNASGVTEPSPVTFFSGQLSLIVDIL